MGYIGIRGTGAPPTQQKDSVIYTSDGNTEEDSSVNRNSVKEIKKEQTAKQQALACVESGKERGKERISAGLIIQVERRREPFPAPRAPRELFRSLSAHEPHSSLTIHPTVKSVKQQLK